jgi:hypothetical protein
MPPLEKAIVAVKRKVKNRLRNNRCEKRKSISANSLSFIPVPSPFCHNAKALYINKILDKMENWTREKLISDNYFYRRELKMISKRLKYVAESEMEWRLKADDFFVENEALKKEVEKAPGRTEQWMRMYKQLRIFNRRLQKDLNKSMGCKLFLIFLINSLESMLKLKEKKSAKTPKRK